jgi:hypothetical protein
MLPPDVVTMVATDVPLNVRVDWNAAPPGPPPAPKMVTIDPDSGNLCVAFAAGSTRSLIVSVSVMVVVNSTDAKDDVEFPVPLSVWVPVNNPLNVWSLCRVIVTLPGGAPAG